MKKVNDNAEEMKEKAKKKVIGGKNLVKGASVKESKVTKEKKTVAMRKVKTGDQIEGEEEFEPRVERGIILEKLVTKLTNRQGGGDSIGTEEGVKKNWCHQSKGGKE